MKKKNFFNQSGNNKVIYLLLLSCLFCFGQASAPAFGQAFGAKLLSKSEYAKLQTVNWNAILSNKSAIASLSTTSVFLNTPPIGDQGTQGSCVGWAVGYAATSILAYPKFNSWDAAERSPNYIYNQIKASTDCSSGSITSDALNLVINQGDCSLKLMPYVNSSCSATPTNSQKFDAALNTVTTWGKITTNDVSAIKNALNLGYPVIVAFPVYLSAYNAMISTGIVSSNDGLFQGNHAVCIIGYDDTKQMFKVQNSWGTSSGDKGYFWFTYNLINQGCLAEAYVLYGINQSIYPSISGSDIVCSQSTYTLNNLPTNASIAWSSSNTSIATVSGSGATATVTKVANGSFTLNAIVSIGSATYTLTKTIWNGVPEKATSIAGIYIGKKFPKNSLCYFSARYPYNEGITNYIWSTSGGTIVEGQGTCDVSIQTKNITSSSLYILNVGITYANSCGTSPYYYCSGYIDPSLNVMQRYQIPSDSTNTVSVANENSVETGTSITLKNEGVIIYPNPIGDVLNITVSEEFIDGGLQIININGKIVKSFKISDLTISLSVQDLLPGVYTVMFNYKGKTEVRKIVKK